MLNSPFKAFIQNKFFYVPVISGDFMLSLDCNPKHDDEGEEGTGVEEHGEVLSSPSAFSFQI